MNNILTSDCENCSRPVSPDTQYCYRCTLEIEENKYKFDLLYVCPVCTAHVRSTYEEYKERGKRCVECHASGSHATYPFKSYTEVYAAILEGRRLSYKIAEGFSMTAYMITHGWSEPITQSIIVGPSGGTICLGEREVKAGIRRTFPHLWKDEDQNAQT